MVVVSLVICGLGLSGLVERGFSGRLVVVLLEIFGFFGIECSKQLHKRVFGIFFKCLEF